MTSKRSSLQTVGRITGVFGIKGWVKVKSYTEPETNIVEYSPWRLKTRHGIKEVKITDHQFRPQGLVVHIDNVDDRDLAATYRNVDIVVDRSIFDSLSDGEYYWHQLIGLKVITFFEGMENDLGTIDLEVVDLGIVKSLMETGANDVLVVSPTDTSLDDRERLIPYVPGRFVQSVDLEKNTVKVDWDPEF